MQVTNQPRCARLAAWTTAVLRGRASVDEALDALTRHDQSVSFANLADEETHTTLAMAVGRLRTDGVTGLAYVPALPGDVSGLPGPPAFNALAVSSGGAAVAVDGVAQALLPSVTHSGSSDDFRTHVNWRSVPVSGFALPSTETVADAERQLLVDLNRSLDELSRLDVAQWRDEANDLLHGRVEVEGSEIPPSLPDRARRLILRSEQMTRTLCLALGDEGGAVSSSEAHSRRRTLVELLRTTTHASVTAWNVGLGPMSR